MWSLFFSFLGVHAWNQCGSEPDEFSETQFKIVYLPSFKLNATNADGEVITFSEGHFYKIPLGQ